MTSPRLGPSDAAVLETFVVPRYLALFGEAALEMFLSGESAAVVHLGCRTGYPDELIADRLTSGSIVGLDPSPPSIELARTKGALIPTVSTDYEVSSGFPTALMPQSFTHGISLHPSIVERDRLVLMAEMARLIIPEGQVLLAMPMRGSFQEIVDLLREYSLKFDDGEMNRAAEAALFARPTVEKLTEELEAAGFDEIDVDLRPVSLAFQSGRDLMEDPIVRLLVLPEIVATLGDVPALDEPFKYVEQAINRYWSEEPFELTVNVGCASGRRVA
ncbi:MAG TPA: class I SAM-dependent methyltransferase [Polyangiaceae bacterium]|nr:class I SAM-dependent methyltransferase [Polyangiaceae bacterium]